jgi:hypothetical protein
VSHLKSRYSCRHSVHHPNLILGLGILNVNKYASMRLTGGKLEAGQKKISTYIQNMLDGSCCSESIDC